MTAEKGIREQLADQAFGGLDATSAQVPSSEMLLFDGTLLDPNTLDARPAQLMVRMPEHMMRDLYGKLAAMFGDPPAESSGERAGR